MGERGELRVSRGSARVPKSRRVDGTEVALRCSSDGSGAQSRDGDGVFRAVVCRERAGWIQITQLPPFPLDLPNPKQDSRNPVLSCLFGTVLEAVLVTGCELEVLLLFI